MESFRKALIVATTALALCGAEHVQAEGAAPQPFTQDAFETAQKAGRPILIDVYAPWCDVCSRQKVVLDKLRAEARYDGLVTFMVNFDAQKDILRRFNARMQSTLICFHGVKEVSRSVGETQDEWIDETVSKVIAPPPAT